MGAGVTQSGSNHGELVGAVERVEQSAGQKPRQVVADGGFSSRENVVALDENGIDFIGSMDEHNERLSWRAQRQGAAA
ncbi:MAG: hypothetical protein QME60_01830 [Verrucomicrobiota bacterium]|nr:hypothetical protein [Verrucomicrobiota bacterium]